MIRGVFFDFDGTLYDRDAAIVRLAEDQFSMFRERFPHVEMSTFVERVVALDAHGHGRVMRLHHKLAEDFGISENVADDLEAYFRSEYPKYCRASEETLETLRRLRSGGLKLGIVTNGPTNWQSRKIDAMGVAQLFDTIVISGSEGIEKPNPEIFERAMERCGVSAAESVFVGDHPVADIQGAIAAGMRPVWMRMEYWDVPEEVVRIERIGEVMRLLET